MITDPDDPHNEIPEQISKMTEANRKRYTADVKVMNYILQAIPDDIYNSMDACKDAQKMWGRIRRESLDSVYERLSTLVNVMDHNDVPPIKVSINTKFLNSLQLEWSKYVTLTRQNKDLRDKFSTPTNNRLYTSSNTRNQAVKNDDRVDIQTKNAEYGGNGNRNAGRQNRNQSINARNGQFNRLMKVIRLGNYARDYPKHKVRDAKYFREQMLLAMKDEAGGTLNDEENDFMLDNAYGDETLKELTVVVIMMAQIQLVDDNAETDPKYDVEVVSEVNASHIALISSMISKKGVHEHKDHEKLKTVINTSDDDQIDYNIIFDDPYVETNGGTVEHDSNAHD
ncbi:hypothetical protein Tco_0781673 [Tanacetum coccineum]